MDRETGSSRLNAIGTATDKQTALDYTHSVLEDARGLVGRVEDLVARLIGHVPTAEGLSGPAPAQTGALDALRDHAQAISRRLADAHSEIDRLNRQL